MRVLNKLIWPHQVKVKEIPIDYGVDVRTRWVAENVSKDKWRINGNTYCFADQDDAMLFKLTWL
jgi:hypothetical protein